MSTEAKVNKGRTDCDVIFAMKHHDIKMENCSNGKLNTFNFLMDVTRQILLGKCKIESFDDLHSDVMMFTHVEDGVPIVTSSVSEELLPKFFFSALLFAANEEFGEETICGENGGYDNG